jgi:NosR/NirI family transcriptional regulator, nitrous oxide reductase regulator
LSNVTLKSQPSRQQRTRRIERILALGALALIGLAWILGSLRAEADLMPMIRQAAPEAGHFERDADGIYTAWIDSERQELLGYVAIGSANGYGGPLDLAVAVDLDGQITGLSVVSHGETQSWFDRVAARGVQESLIGKSYTDDFQLGVDVDNVTGATATSRALAEAALAGSRLAAEQLGFEVAEREAPSIQFGVPEIAVLALFAVGYIGHRRGFKYKNQFRWGSMLAGLIILGFLYNIPITVAYFSRAILGYWPDWQINLYWYFLLGGILFVVTADNKNPYCSWFCPFGAAQECMGVIGGAKTYAMRRYRIWLKWVQRGLALSAILLGVFFRSPGLSSFEIFGTLFSLVGNNIEIAVLALVLIASLFIRRPWCNYLCPVDPVVEFIRIIRQWIGELWQKVNPRTKNA